MASDSQRRAAESIGVPVAKRHIFLCCDQTTPKCCEKERGLAAWEFLLAINERSALTRLHELTELERTPLPRPKS